MSSLIVMFRKTHCILFKVSETENNILCTLCTTWTEHFFLQWRQGRTQELIQGRGFYFFLSRGGPNTPPPPWKPQNSLFQGGNAEPPKTPCDVSEWGKYLYNVVTGQYTCVLG